MALTDAQKQVWLSEDFHRVVIADIQYHDGTSMQVLRIASHPYVMPFGDSTIDPITLASVENLQYDDIISKVPNIITRIDTDSTNGAISILNTDGEYDYLLNTVTLTGHSIKIYIGDINWPRDNFITILDGIISQVASSSPDTIQLSLRDKKETLNVPLQTELFTDTIGEFWDSLMDDINTAGNFTGDVGGTRGYSRVLAVIPPDIQNTHVPICLGKCFNIEPVLVDSWNHIYFIHSSGDLTIDSLTTVSEVRSNGVILNSALDTPISGVAQQYEVDLTLGVLRLLDHPSGTQITCDVVSQNERSSIVPADHLVPPYELVEHSAAFIIEWILLEKAGLPFTDMCDLSFPAAGTYGFSNIIPLGIYYKEETTALDVITKVINSVGGFLRFKDDACKLQLYLFIEPDGETPDLYLIEDDIIEDGIRITSVEEPKKSITLGCKKNWKTQDEGSLAQVLTDISSPYYDIENLNSFKNNYSTLYSTTGISDTEYPLAEDISLIETFIYDETDAQQELDRRIILRSKRRRVITIQSLATSFTYDVGDIVNVRHDRFSLKTGTTGTNGIIIGIEESPTSKRVNLDIWL